MSSRIFMVGPDMEICSYIKDNKGVLEDEVGVDFDIKRFGMKETGEGRRMIEDSWEEVTKNNKRTYNQSKFRLTDHRYNKGIVEMDIGMTNYKDHVGTNLSSSYRDKFFDIHEKKFDMMSQCLAVGGWVVTTDKKVLLVETAAWKGEQACKVDRPGGHAEPDLALGQELSGYKDLTGDMVVREIFESISKEIRDEINVDIELQSKPELLGIITNLDRAGRSALEFLIKLDISSHEVESLYKKGGLEADESTNLFFIEMENLKKIDKSLMDRFTPYVRGSIELLKQRMGI